MRTGAIILCGGKSSRMGRDKAMLPFGPECMLQRVARRLSEVVPHERMVVVAAVDQILPELPAGISLARDLQPERGPLEGLAAGLRMTSDQVDAVFITGCDVPLLKPQFVRRMFELAADVDIAVPRDGERLHPLAAVYRHSVLPHVERLLDAAQLRLRLLFHEVRTREIDVDELRSIDPQLDTLKNLNTPEDYAAALSAAGL